MFAPVIVTSIVSGYYRVVQPIYNSWGDDGLAFGNSSPIEAVVLRNVISWGLQAFAIYLVIIWSRQHNRQFDQPTTKTEPST